jgi:hypothetical protein
MKNLMYLFSREIIKEIEDTNNAYTIEVLVFMFIPAVMLDTLLLPVTILLSLIVKR